MPDLFAVTSEGLVRLTEDQGGWEAVLVRADARMQCVALDPADASTLYVGSRGSGVWKSSDGGQAWQDLELPEADVFSLAVSPADGAVYAGTEPSRLFKSDDGGRTWRELEGLQEIPSRPEWSFPPRPETSHVRVIAPNPHDAEVLLVGIELGGLMRSGDGGRTWSDHRPGAQKDVHALAWHPQAEGRAYEAGGGGAAYSADGGARWEAADEGLGRHYTWGLAVDDEDPDVWYVSAARSARRAHSREDADARIYRRRGGGSWEALSGGLPDPLRSFPYALLAAEGRVIAGFGNGAVYVSADRGETWREAGVRGASLRGLRRLAHPPGG